MTEPTILAQCQVRIKAESPCPHRAVVEIRGVAFCGPCAREQEAYFAIGELVAQDETQGLRGKLLAKALKRMRREHEAGTGNAAAEMHHGHSGVYEPEPLVLSSS